MLTDLADVLRRADLQVIERTGWRTRGHGGGRCACSPCTSAPFTAVASITLHHTAGSAVGDMPSLDVVENGRTSLPGPLAQLALSRSGVWFTVAAGVSYHAGVVAQPWQGNGYAIGIEAEATGTATWPDVQYRSYVRGVKALADRYGVPVARVLGHKEVAVFPAGHPQAGQLGRKVDPNFSVAAFRAALYTQEDIVSAWSEVITNAYGAKVQAVQVLNGTEVRVADAQARLGKLEAKVDALALGGVDVDALARKVADLLAVRLSA